MGYVFVYQYATEIYPTSARTAVHSVGYYMLHGGFAGMKMFINMGYVFVYQYATGIYPTSARTAGTGLVFACGRFGAICAPMALEGLWQTTGTWTTFFYAMASTCAVNAVLIAFLPHETKNRTLQDHVDEIGEGDPLMACTQGKACWERPLGASA